MPARQRFQALGRAHLPSRPARSRAPLEARLNPLLRFVRQRAFSDRWRFGKLGGSASIRLERAGPTARRYNRGMIETTLPLAPDLSAPVSAPAPAPLLEQLATLRLENTVLRAQNAVLQERIRELGAGLGQDSSSSSRPPSSDPPQAARKRQRVPSGRKRGGHPSAWGVPSVGGAR